MISDRILCENIEAYKQDKDFNTILKIIEENFKQGVFDIGAGYCGTTSLLLQSIFSLHDIPCEVIEVSTALLNKNTNDSAFIGFEEDAKDSSSVPTHVILITKTATPYLIDLSIGRLLNLRYIGVCSAINKNINNLNILAEFNFIDYRFVYTQKKTGKFSQIYETSVINRINTDKKIFNDIKVLKYLNYTAIILSLFSVINFITRVFL